MMSKKGQDNQRGINFQNYVALLYILNSYKSPSFSRVSLEGDNFEDFALFFYSSNRESFHNFEVKSWEKPIEITRIREIIGKEVKKGVERYRTQGSFFIVAPSFKKECKNAINKFKKTFFFYYTEDFNLKKQCYKKYDPNNPLLLWDEKEISLLKFTELIELKKNDVEDKVLDHLHYGDSFYYTKENSKNLISRILTKITEESSSGGKLTQNQIEKIISQFKKNEAEKSESYNLEKDLGKVITDINKKIETEEGFKKLNKERYITPISGRKRVIFYIIKHLKEKNFNLETFKWFIDKILIKKSYFFNSLDLIKEYIEKHQLNKQDLEYILDFFYKIYEKECNLHPFNRWNFYNFYNGVITVLLKISKQTCIVKFKDKLIKFLKKILPNLKEIQGYDEYYAHNLVKFTTNVFEYRKEGVDFLFEMHVFIEQSEEDTSGDDIYYKYIRKFIDIDFKNNFQIVINKLNEQFKWLYKEKYNKTYKGYEVIGLTFSGIDSHYSLYRLKIEFLFDKCIKEFYNKTKDWEYLEFIINNNRNMFVKRSFIPFLLEHCQSNASLEEHPKGNKFYKILESVLSIKKGVPRTEEVVAQYLYRNLYKNLNIQDIYLEHTIDTILYKYSKEGVSFSIIIIQLLFHLIENGKLQFKKHLKRILFNKEFKNYFIYKNSINILENKIHNQNILDFFYEIKDKVDISQYQGLLYFDVTSKQNIEESKLLLSSSKKDLDNLAGVIQRAILKNNHEFIKLLLTYLNRNLENFYERSEGSIYLKGMIARLVPHAMIEDIVLAENIIKLCLEDTEPCGENQQLHDDIAKGNEFPIMDTMRTYLCDSIQTYIFKCIKQNDTISFQKLKKIFFMGKKTNRLRWDTFK